MNQPLFDATMADALNSMIGANAAIVEDEPERVGELGRATELHAALRALVQSHGATEILFALSEAAAVSSGLRADDDRPTARRYADLSVALDQAVHAVTR